MIPYNGHYLHPFFLFSVLLTSYFSIFAASLPTISFISRLFTSVLNQPGTFQLKAYSRLLCNPSESVEGMSTELAIICEG